ncbi:MAG: ATPase domain-containing protein [Candidatus Micrarchaeota archaeon]
MPEKKPAGVGPKKSQSVVKMALNEKGEVIYRREGVVGGSRFAAGAAVEAVNRIKTGISGFDELLEGGIPRGSTTLIAGGCGSGKSIFCMQALVNGAALYGEPGVYITFEELPESMRAAGAMFGWKIEALEKRKLLKIIFKDPYEIKDFSKTLSGELYYTLRDINAKRVVIDSITYLGSTAATTYEVRKTVATLARRLKEIGCTTFLVSEIPEGGAGVGRYGMEEFVSDGVINLHNILIKDTRQRAVEILKMRRTKHDTLLHPFRIDDKGITVFPHEQVFK